MQRDTASEADLPVAAQSSTVCDPSCSVLLSFNAEDIPLVIESPCSYNAFVSILLLLLSYSLQYLICSEQKKAKGLENKIHLFRNMLCTFQLKSKSV